MEQSQVNPKVAFEHQRVALRNFKEFVSGLEDENWVLPALEQLCLDVRLLAARTDDEATRNGDKCDAYELAMSDLRECFVVVSSDRASLHTSKKWAMMFLVNHLFFISFKLNNFSMVESLRRAMLRDTEMMNFFHMSHRVW